MPTSKPPTAQSLTQPLRWISSHMLVTRFVPLLFAPAGVMLLTLWVRGRAIAITTAADLLTIALVLFCIELAWMAYVDLSNVSIVVAQRTSSSLLPQALSASLPEIAESEVAAQTIRNEPKQGQPRQDNRPEQDKWRRDNSFLNHFFNVVISTIVLELIGFYGALLSLPLGAVVIIASQIWFNLLADIQLFPKQSPAIVPCGIRQRADILTANGVALCLLYMWSITTVRWIAASGILILIVLFLVLKYVPLIYAKLTNSP